MSARAGIALFFFAALPLLAQEPVTWTTGTYQYDGSGNIKFIDGRPYRYDELGRLTRAQVDATHAETFTYDDFGNILTIQKDGQAAVTLGVSHATNRLTDTAANAHAQYNADGSIASTVTGDTFAYDGLGMVTESKVGVTRRLYLYTASEERIATVMIQNGAAGTRQWTIRNPSGAVLTRFTQTAAGTWSWDQDYVYANGRLLAAKVSGPEKVRHFFPDHLGTPRVITGNGGMELSRHTYYAYGEEVTTTTSPERLKFTGHERDDPTLDYMHARYYAPMWGRFLSVDPSGASARPHTPQTWNRYSYARNQPLMRIDPDGERDVYIALWSKRFPYVIGKGSVGHLAMFELSGKTIVNQFPTPHGMHGKNTTLTYKEAVAYEKRRPDRVIRVTIKDDKGLDEGAKKARTAGAWDWSPDGPSSKENDTHCADAILAVLEEAGIEGPFIMGPYLPNDLMRWIWSNREIKPKEEKDDVLEHAPENDQKPLDPKAANGGW